MKKNNAIVPYGYDSPAGYRGRLPDGRWMLFPTFLEYIEYISNEDDNARRAQS